MKPGYLIGVGSNLEPELNASRILDALVRRFGEIAVSRIYYTVPVQIASDHRFVNFCCFIPSTLDPVDFKSECIAIEVALGRDRGNPLRKVLDRTADLDLLLCLTGSERGLRAEDFVPADYLLQPAREIVALLGHAPMPAREGEICPIALNGGG